MITVIVGTNRKNSRSAVVAQYIYQQLKAESDETVELLNLEELPAGIISADMYSADKQSASITALQDRYLIPANKWYVVAPEYNGGIPGIFKFVLDACSIREYQATFHGGKKVALVGIAAGRSGGLRGLEYMTGFFNYLKMTVLPNKLPISNIGKLLTDNELTDENTREVLDQQVAEFLAF